MGRPFGLMKVAVVIPCYNESMTLAPVVAGAIAAADVDVFVVDDGSTDGSDIIARDNGATVVPTKGREGYDGAIETGLRHAHSQGYHAVITIDADGEHDPALVADFTKALTTGTDLVSGIRPAPQRLAEWVVCWYCKRTFGINDILCGMKGYSRPVLDAYFDQGQPNLVNTWPAVVWASAGNSVEQINVTGTPRTDTPRYSSLMRANWRIIQLLPKFARQARTR